MKAKACYPQVEAIEWIKDGDQPDLVGYSYPLGLHTEECGICGKPLSIHASLDAGEAGYVICPYSWIIIPQNENPPKIDGYRPPPFVLNWFNFSDVYEKVED